MAITKPFTFRAGEKARANEVNQDFDILYAEVNRIGTEIINLDVEVQSVDTGKANVNGDATKRFQSAPGVNPYDVVNVQQLGQLVPVGTLIAVAHENNLEGYLECDGSTYSRSTYQALFDVIGTTYGAGDGTNTFKVPDLRGRVLWGKEDNKTLGYREAGLPNITASVYTDRSRFSSSSGAFYIVNSGTQERGGIGSGNGTLNFDASRSSSIYGKSSTVQPPSTLVRFLIKYI